jgi:hypothetical protein
LRDVGRVKLWRGDLPQAPQFRAKIFGNDPMRFVER